MSASARARDAAQTDGAAPLELQLDALQRLIDERYARATAPLVDATLEVRDLVSGLERLAAAEQGAERTEMAAALAELVASAEARSARDGEARREVEARLETADDSIAALRRTANAIGMVALSARVAAARIDTRSRVHGIFTEEMADASAALIAATGEVDRARIRLREHVEESAAEEAGLSALDLGAAARRLSEAETALHAAGSRDAQSRRDAQRSAGEIASRLRDLVAALQAGDAVSQRVGHAAQTQRALGPAEAAAMGPHAVAVAHALIAAQIRGAAEELSTRSRAGLAAAGRLRNELDRRERIGEAAADREVDDMTEALHEIEKRLTAAARGRSAAATRSTGLRDALAGLHAELDRLHRVEQRTQTLSINASISCARSGEHGRALMVISSEMADLSAAVRGHQREAASCLAAAGEAAERMLRGEDSQTGSISGILQQARAELADTRARRKAVANALHAVHGHGDALHQALQQLEPMLAAPLETLETLASGMSPPSAGGRPAEGAALEAARAWFAARRKESSMQSERALFDRAVPQIYRPAETPAPPPAPAAALDDFEEF